MKSIICPISTRRIDSNVSRITIFLNVTLMVAFLLTSNPIYITIVTLDYFVRAAIDVRYSPFRFLASGSVQTLGLKNQPIDLAPKTFASRLGFLCALVSAAFILTGYPVASMSVAALLMILSALDSIFNFCVGCLIYHHIVYPIWGQKEI